MTLKGGTSQACAACKYQRRKCSSECPLAPYFPPDQPKMFADAHRLFGVSNILKILKQLDPTQKLTAMQSIIYQATIRERYPVSGCLGLICQLHYQIRQTEDELHVVLSQLEICRQHHHQQIQMASAPSDSSSSPLELGCSALSLHHNPPPPPPEYNAVSVAGGGDGGLPVGVGTHHPYSPTTNAPFNFDFLDPKDNSLNPAWPQNSFSITNNNDVHNSLTIQPQPVATQPLPLQPQAAQDYDEIHPFFDTFDDRQSYVDSKEAYESSSESSFKDATQSTDNVAENELKSAAACFSLISLGQ